MLINFHLFPVSLHGFPRTVADARCVRTSGSTIGVFGLSKKSERLTQKEARKPTRVPPHAQSSRAVLLFIWHSFVLEFFLSLLSLVHSVSESLLLFT